MSAAIGKDPGLSSRQLANLHQPCSNPRCLGSYAHSGPCDVPSVVEGVGPEAPTVKNELGGAQSHAPYRFDLVDAKAMFAMTKVLSEGAVKYGDNNWRAISIQDHLNHLIMHAYAYLAGDESDEHLAHIMCRATFAQAVEIQGGPVAQ